MAEGNLHMKPSRHLLDGKPFQGQFQSMAALGRPFKVGDIYAYHQDRILSGKYLKCQLNQSDSIFRHFISALLVSMLVLFVLQVTFCHIANYFQESTFGNKLHCRLPLVPNSSLK